MMTTYGNKLSKYIYSKRRTLEMSRADLADRLTQNGYECTESAVNHWENGRADPPLEDPIFARALALALDVPPSQLIEAAGVFRDLTPENAENILIRFSPAVLQLLENASPQSIKKVEAIIRVILSEDE